MPAKLKLLYTREEIQTAVNRLALEISRDYEGRTPVIIGVLKGSFVLVADLARALDVPSEIDFITATSYAAQNKSSGRVQIIKDIDTDILERDVILVEDIVDTGLTVSVLLNHLRAKNPASIKLCTLIEKHSGRHIPLKVDYAGFCIDDGFAVGYGLDYNGQFRNLSALYVMLEEG